MSKVPALNLVGAALAGALALEKQFPDIVFTSGARGVVDQARAMAQNIAKSGRNWITRTYVSTAESRQLQAWVDKHPSASTAGDIATGLATIMAAWTPAQRSHLSSHFSGLAFDVQPLPPGLKADKIKAAIRALPGLDKFLEQEGGLLRWHAQFHA